MVKGCPTTALNGKWLANEMASCLSALANSGFKVRAIVTDNHAANADALKLCELCFQQKAICT